mmetsp:Transcript_80992/g.242636  ORF Transcript_80992/g.242636 Transcript_80992/m.242636 type:complete len:89 (+) Transcript_80992:34-300(+)|eukprot:5065410-Prymnesium_polylepis.2
MNRTATRHVHTPTCVRPCAHRDTRGDHTASRDTLLGTVCGGAIDWWHLRPALLRNSRHAADPNTHRHKQHCEYEQSMRNGEPCAASIR